MCTSGAAAAWREESWRVTVMEMEVAACKSADCVKQRVRENKNHEVAGKQQLIPLSCSFCYRWVVQLQSYCPHNQLLF